MSETGQKEERDTNDNSRRKGNCPLNRVAVAVLNYVFAAGSFVTQRFRV